MALDPAAFRHTLSHLASGVTVVTVLDAEGNAHGMTASAVTSLSLVPPMVLVCVDHNAQIHERIVRAGVFGICILGEDQRAVAERFADRDRHEFGIVRQHTPAGLPRIDGAIAHLDVRRGEVHQGGDHSIITGVVEWSDTSDGRPLVYFRSNYGLRP